MTFRPGSDEILQMPDARTNLLGARHVYRCTHLMRHCLCNILNAGPTSFSTSAMRSATGVAIQPGSAALAAATAAFVSAASPSEVTAQGSSVDGSMTWINDLEITCPCRCDPLAIDIEITLFDHGSSS